MNITLCQNLSENNIINKSIIDVENISAVIKGPISVETPVLLLQYNSSLQDINYFKIPEFDRCYYITDVVDLTGGRYQITGKSDVLESFKTAILGLTAIVDKQQGASLVNMYIDDGSYMVENKEFNSVINFPNGFNSEGEYILITAGGGGGII